MFKTISSQRFINDAIVARKIADADFEVSVSPIFALEDGTMVRVVLDGHHSYHAAIEAGATPEFIELTEREHDAIGILGNGSATDFLDATYIDSDYYDIVTGYDI